MSTKMKTKDKDKEKKQAILADAQNWFLNCAEQGDNLFDDEGDVW